MEIPKIKTKVVHSQSKSAWNVIGDSPGSKFKIARVPYVLSPSEELNALNRKEAFHHAEYISFCFNNSEKLKLHP